MIMRYFTYLCKRLLTQVYYSMATVKVKLEVSYGYDCTGCGYGSEDTIGIEVSENVLGILRNIDASEIPCEKVMEALEEGNSELEDLHDEIEDAFYNMIEEYWLFEAYNECLSESLSSAMERDIESGEYTPVSFDEFVAELESGELGLTEFKLGRFDDFWELEDKYSNYLLNCYYNWVCEHDHEFIAERVGLDLDACRDDEVNYTIYLDK